MAFSLESIAAVPLLFTLLLQPVVLGPEAGMESIEQAKEGKRMLIDVIRS